VINPATEASDTKAQAMAALYQLQTVTLNAHSPRPEGVPRTNGSRATIKWASHRTGNRAFSEGPGRGGAISIADGHDRLASVAAQLSFVAGGLRGFFGPTRISLARKSEPKASPYFSVRKHPKKERPAPADLSSTSNCARAALDECLSTAQPSRGSILTRR
jgi:hypothetical protein